MKFIIIIVIALLAAPAATFGYESYVTKVPNGSAFRCATCHAEGKFKKDFKDNDLKWNKALATKDSDGDRASNGVELQDPEGKWTTSKPDPKIPGWNTYNPDDRTSVPPYAPVDPTSMGRVKALFK
jgi:hypothetical protein